MKQRPLIALTGAAMLALPGLVHGQDWDVSVPDQPSKEVTITVDEGTWMNLDVSPNGQELVFDLLGDIYTLPMSGGKATLLREGHAWEVQPRYSPDGSQILFTSDAGGGDNIWVMDRNGDNARQVTKETFRLLNNGTWTPDGQFIIARKHFTSTRSLGAGEMWQYHISGGSGIQLTQRKNDQQDVNEPSVSPDGQYLYFSEDFYPGGFFQYNKDPNSQIYMIRRYNRETGEIEGVTGGPGSAFRPQISRDGKKLAFVRRMRTKTVLYVRDLATGREWPIFEGLSKDQSEAWAIFGVYTGYNWTPDNQHIVIWGQGKLWKVNVSTYAATEIPFEASATHKLVETVRFQQEVAPEQFTAKVIRDAVTSPDGKWLVFNAVGYLWKKELPNGTPSRITKSTDFEFEPSFSRDGKWLTYVTWNDQNRGALMKVEFGKRNAVPTKLSTEQGIYRTPSFSPNGQQLVFWKEGGNSAQGYTYTEKSGLYLMSANGGQASMITDNGSHPEWNETGDRIYYLSGGTIFGGLSKSYRSVNLQGFDERTHFTSTYGTDFKISPDGNWVAFKELFKVYVAAMPKSGQPFSMSHSTTSVPVAQVARDAGLSLHWSADSKKIHWMLGQEYFTNNIGDRFEFLGQVDSIPPMDTVGLPVNLVLDTDTPEGTVAFTHAKIITMNGDEVIEDGTLVVEGNRITAVGAFGEVAVPRGAKVIEVDGATIMPGMVDAHAHMGTFRQGLSPQKQPSYWANLAYGVTTTHDPSSNTEMVFSQSEMVKAGHMVGPRIFSTGIILYGADGDFKAVVNNLDDARSALRRTKAYGAFSVKSYNQPRRDQRQQIIQAARELNMMVVPEGGSTMYHNLTQVLDGHTTIEHNLPVAPVYEDVLQLWGAAGTAYTPTLIVNYGSVNGEYYWYQKTNVWEKERLLRYMPRGPVDSRARHRTMIPDEEYENGHILTSESVKAMNDRGVLVNTGAHGQLDGLGQHWELWMMHQGGMSNLQALKTATINGAISLGLDESLGSLEVGKLADLIVIDGDPLSDIYDTEKVKYTVINGRVYNSETMEQVYPTTTAEPVFWWEENGYDGRFEWHEETKGFMTPRCHCGAH